MRASFRNRGRTTASPGKRTAEELGGTSTDPTGMEVMVGEDEEAYIARQQRLQAEAKARMAAKFGPPATPTNSPVPKTSSLPSASSAEIPPQSPRTNHSPLPDGWTMHPSKDYPGRHFFAHEPSGASQWERPTAPPTSATTPPATRTAPANGSVQVTFVEQGSLGLKFSPDRRAGSVVLLAVNPGSQAERHTQLQAGLVLHSVDGSGVAGWTYEQVLEKIKKSRRPLTLTFSPGSDAISVTFSKPGTLGLKFTPDKRTGAVQLLQVNPGTQAEDHSQLQPGLILQSVGGASVSGKSYQDVLGMLKAGGRPLTLSFFAGASNAEGTVAGPSNVLSRR